MISHEYKTIFIHINRTGGVSVETAFGKAVMDHSLPEDIISIIGKDKWDTYLKFAFVRNPWDRLVSVYFNRKTWNNEITYNFHDWLKTIENDKWLIQADWLSKDGQLIVDYIGRFENLANDFAVICDKIGASFNLPHLNATNHFHYTYYYDTKSAEMIEKWCKKDIDMFGYKFHEKPKLW